MTIPDSVERPQAISTREILQHFAGEDALDMNGARVAVLGCGSVGGLAAWCCASAGVHELLLADRDVLEEDNRRRHVNGSADLGRPKAQALAAFLGQHFDSLHVEA